MRDEVYLNFRNEQDRLNQAVWPLDEVMLSFFQMVSFAFVVQNPHLTSFVIA